MKWQILFVMLLAIGSVFADISLQDEPYSVGSPIKITISPALDDQMLVIAAPNATYRFIGGVSEETTFVPDEEGAHTVQVLWKNELIESSSFTVGSSQESSHQLVSTETATTGEPIAINAPVIDVKEVAVLYEGQRFTNRGTTRPIVYVPEDPGTYTVVVAFFNGTEVSSTITVTGDTQKYIPQRDIRSKPFTVQKGPTTPSILTSTGELVNADMTWKRNGVVVRQAAAERIDKNNLDYGTYTVDLRIPGQSLKNIQLRDVSYQGDLSIGIEEVPVDAVHGAVAPRALHAFAIDPSRVAFTTADVTFTAVGVALYKCEAYNFTTRECGAQEKILDLIPGREYTITINQKDPLFTQSGYLVNPSFTGNTNGWTTLNEGPNTPSFSYVASDTPQTGIGQILLSGNKQDSGASYYQVFNLSIPIGTELTQVNFSAKWRVSQYADGGSAHIWIQNVARTANYCSINTTYAGVTSWRTDMISTATGCPLANFQPNTEYTFRVRCVLSTSTGGGSTETCLWDDANVTVLYNDTQAPMMRNIGDTPDPVLSGNTINITVNVTDNIQVSNVSIEINGTNYTALKNPGDIYYVDTFDTNIAAGVYLYRVFANDTNGNRVQNLSNRNNFTITETIAPNVTTLSPLNNTNISANLVLVSYNVSDASAISYCNLTRNGTVINTTTSPQKDTTLFITGALPSEQTYLFRVRCVDSSGNIGNSSFRTVTRDTINPVVHLNTRNVTNVSAPLYSFNYTPSDIRIANCSLWGNWTGTWQHEQDHLTPTSESVNTFSVETLAYGRNIWNVVCYDLAGNAAFNTTNYTITLDNQPPLWTNNITAPGSGVVYSQGALYTFNVTWTDVYAGVSTVRLETNFTGTLQNVTPTQVGSVYTHTFTDLSAGAYVYRWYANDTLGNRNQTPQYTYIINKSSSSVNLLLNGTDDDIEVGLNDLVNGSGTIVTPSSGLIELYIDNVLVASGSSVENLSFLTVEKRYNYTLIYPATRNYSRSYETHFADVLDTTPPSVVLGNPLNDSIQPETTIFFFTAYDNVDIGNCTVELDGVLNQTKDVSKGVQSNISISGIQDGAHYWTVNCSDLQNNTAINTTMKNFTVDTQAPSIFDLLVPISGNVSTNVSPHFTWEQTSDANFDNYTIQVDNDIGFSSINYISTSYQITNVSRQFSVGDQTVWYWRVFAYDAAGNTRQSTSTFNYTADTIPPTIILQNPSNNSYQNTTHVNFTHTVSDFSAIINCSLFINGLLNQTNTSVNKADTQRYQVQLSEGQHNWSVACYDSAGSLTLAGNRTVYTDTTPPIVFTLLGPGNNSNITDNTPEYNWTQTSDQNFLNYTVHVSDTSTFSNINHSFILLNTPTNNSINQTPSLTDGIWYWRAYAIDLAGNRRLTSPAWKQFTIDTTPPTAFSLLIPSNESEHRDDTPLFTWEQTTDENFMNYTVLVSDRQDFLWFNYSNGTTTLSSTEASIRVQQNITWYWKVIAYDVVGQTRNSTGIFTYLPDYEDPNVSLVSPPNNSIITSSNFVSFQFNVTDIGSIQNCSLFVDAIYSSAIFSPQKNTTLTLSTSVVNGNHTWYVMCWDTANNTFQSVSRNITLNVQIPQQRLYESRPGGAVSTTLQNINLTYDFDNLEDSVDRTIAGGAFATWVNATMTTNGSGMLIVNNSVVNFTGWFSQSNQNTFYVTWKLYKMDTSGATLICQAGNDNSGGTAVGNTAKKELRSSCTNTLGDVRFENGDNLTLIVNGYNSGGNSRSMVHYWEDFSESWVEFTGYKLGALNVTFVNQTNHTIPEDQSYIESCTVSCTDGGCLNTKITLQIYNGTTWIPVGTSENITLNGSQLNPLTYGYINGTNQSNFSVYGNTYSSNNMLRCFGESTYSNATSDVRMVNVTDITFPTITLDAPADTTSFEPQNVTFTYTPSDVRLANCSLWGNWTGVWSLNTTNETPTTDSTNLFGPLFFSYGSYLWNIQCVDESGNANFSTTNYTFIVAGDVEITSENITLSSTTPVEGQTITIRANITNKANRTEENITVQFWLDHPDFGGVQIGENQTVALNPLGWNVSEMNWTVEIGTHNFYVIADPPNGTGLILESNEENNMANRSLFVTMWHIYYGNASGNVTLGSGQNATLLERIVNVPGGVIYVSDSDTSGGISFQFLQALGRNTSGFRNPSTDNDFEELDIGISSSTFSDNVNATYTTNSDPNAVEMYLLYGQNIPNVPVANSTESGNFTTGIVWDTDDSSNAYYDSTDAEDVLFITKVENLTASTYGYVNYEIRIPGRLDEYKGANPTVAFYYELQ